jgi:hypothetical protein
VLEGKMKQCKWIEWLSAMLGRGVRSEWSEGGQRGEGREAELKVALRQHLQVINKCFREVEKDSTEILPVKFVRWRSLVGWFIVHVIHSLTHNF